MTRLPSSEIAAIAGALVLLIAPIGAGVLLLGWHVLDYLKDGQWQPMMVTDALAYLGSAWAVSPTEWLGAHAILAHTPLFAGCWAVALAAVFLIAATFN